jgi:hypothetical protein
MNAGRGFHCEITDMTLGNARLVVDFAIHDRPAMVCADDFRPWGVEFSLSP